MESLDASPQFDSYSKVVIHVADNVDYVAGTDTGRTLEIDNPFGTQQMANDILARLTGYQYQPYTSNGTIINPAAEMGDAVSSPLIYGGIYTRSKTFGRLMKADVSAPQDEDIDHEYQYESPEYREFKRQTSDLRASLVITNNAITSEVTARQNADNNLSSRITQNANSITSEVTRATQAEGTLSSRITQNANNISAKVSSTGGNNSSFGWTLTASGFSLYSGNKEVMKCDKNGLVVKGNIAGSTGTIGGFTIGSSALYTNNMSSMSSTQTTGVLLSSQGIKLGKNFKVDSSGNLTCTNATISGTLTVGGQTITAAQLQQGALSAYNGAGGWNATSSTVSSNGGYWSGGAAGGYEYQNNFVYDGNLGALRYKGSILYANEFRTNIGFNGRFWVTDAYGNGAYRTLYTRQQTVCVGGECYISYQTSTFTGWAFRPYTTTITYVAAS